MRKSEVIVDLTKIHERLEELMDSQCLSNMKEEISSISSQIKVINDSLSEGCLTFSITGRAVSKSAKCRFCGK